MSKHESQSFLEGMKEKVQSTVNESRLPNVNYESTVGIYGGKLKMQDEKMIYDTTGVVSKGDQKGDAVLRTYDEHLLEEPWKLLKKHPKWFLKFLAPGTKRYRGNQEEKLQNIKRLGLQDYYGEHVNGIEIKQQELYTQGIALQDIYRSDQIDSDRLNEIDRFQALATATQHVSQTHKEHGGIGELLTSDIIFSSKDGEQVSEPVLNLPDIVYNPKKQTAEIDKKATEVLEFMFNIGVEELRRSNNWMEVRKALETIVDNYEDNKIIDMVKSYAARGRLVLQGDTEMLRLSDTVTKKARPALAQHNKARLGTTTETEAQLRQFIKDIIFKDQIEREK
ncbi:hypothetical protein KKA15_00590 [Patescibacteria group bacterium]|nr:hypothetical protein [Patescibacteria group bacterium]